MNNIFKIILIVWSTIFMSGCTTQTIIVDRETKISESSKVEWVITNEDSIIDFRKSIDGYAIVQDNNILFFTENDSLHKLSTNELKIIYLRQGDNLIQYIIGGIIVAIVVVFIFLPDVNLTGG